MLNKLITAIFAIVISAGFAQAVSAEQSATEMATIVIYRADESVKTKRVNLGIRGDSGAMGRLSADTVVSAERPAGEYTLTSGVKGSKSLTLDLKPGATHYVHARVGMRGSRVVVEFQEVPEQVAVVQQPALDGTI